MIQVPLFSRDYDFSETTQNTNYSDECRSHLSTSSASVKNITKPSGADAGYPTGFLPISVVTLGTVKC